MNMMRRIAFLQKTNIFSGAENVVITIMNFIPKDQYECVYVSPEGDIREYVEMAGLKFYPMTDSSMKSILIAMGEIQPDIIHATDYGMSSYAARLKMEIPVVAHLHNNAPWLKNPWHPKNIIFTRAIPQVSAIISVSDAVEEDYIHRNKIKKKNHVIHNTVDLKRIYSMSEEKNTEKSQDIVFFGRQSPPKNPHRFCDIVREYKKQNPDVSACMIGGGELLEKIRKYVDVNGLSENIKLYGFQKNPYKLVKGGKILVMPSNYEGFGLAAVECMALGKPVVCSGAGGLKEIVDEQCGAICNTNQEYLDEIEKLLHDREYYGRKSENAKKKAKQFGDMEAYIKKITAVYDEVLEVRNK